MKRSLVRDPDSEAKGMLFGSKLQPVNLTVLAEKTAISTSTLCNYRKTPGKIPLERFSLIAKARRLNDEQIGKIVRAYWGEMK